MSMTFYVKNKKKLFGYAAVLSVAEALQVLPDLSFFNFDENAEGFDKDKFMRSKLSDYACLLLGVEGLSGRGFEGIFSLLHRHPDDVLHKFLAAQSEEFRITLVHLHSHPFSTF